MRWMILGFVALVLSSASCNTETTCGCLCDEGGIIAHCSSSMVGDGGAAGGDGSITD